jgi:hypothetical protein
MEDTTMTMTMTMTMTTANALMAIAPYWSEAADTWVYDDPAHGRQVEPFVAGTPEIIDRMLERADLPRRRPFVAVFGARPFPGHQFVLGWAGAQYEGNVYRWEDLSGWLCPALFDYFETAPQTIYLQFRGKEA